MTHVKIESGFNTLFIENVVGVRVARRSDEDPCLNWNLAANEPQAALLFCQNNRGEQLVARFKGYVYLINEQGKTIDTISSERV